MSTFTLSVQLSLTLSLSLPYSLLCYVCTDCDCKLIEISSTNVAFDVENGDEDDDDESSLFISRVFKLVFLWFCPVLFHLFFLGF